jgi:putative peptidoglycan lipid II flippase
MFPFLLLVGLWAYAMGLLNSLGKFASSAFGPCLLNISVILCAAWFGENVFGLAGGILVGGVLQLAIQLPQLYASGWRLRVTPEFRHPQARKIGVLLVPRALGACVYQVNVFVSTILASLSSIVGDGAVAAIYYANRIWQLPLAIFGIALAQAALPAMSRHAALNDTEKLKEHLSFSLKALFFILIPSSAGLMVLSAPIVKALFQRGAFGPYSTMITSEALFYYALGLVACGGIKVLVSAFYALHDTVTPVKAAVMSLVINVALNIALMWPLKVGGLALATSISAVFNFLALYIMLARRIGDFGTAAIVSSFLKVALASAVMAALLFVLMKHLTLSPAHLIAVIAAGIAAFLAAAFVFDVRELKEAFEWISKRR